MRNVPLCSHDVHAYQVRKGRTTVFKPSRFEGVPLPSGKTAPHDRVALEWCHGYRGHDGQPCNLYFLKGDREVVYIASCLGVIQSLEEHKQRFYRGHALPVCSIAIHPNKLTIATGEVGRFPTIQARCLRAQFSQFLPYPTFQARWEGIPDAQM